MKIFEGTSQYTLMDYRSEIKELHMLALSEDRVAVIFKDVDSFFMRNRFYGIAIYAMEKLKTNNGLQRYLLRTNADDIDYYVDAMAHEIVL